MAAHAPLEGATLSNRQLNRSFLARQLLLERQRRPAASVIEHLAGMQSQVPRDPFIGLWSRIEGFGHGELDRLMLDREVVRIVAMRGTIHLLTIYDACMLRPAMQATLEKSFMGSATYAPNLAGLDLEEIADAGRRLVEDRPLTGKQIGASLAHIWPGRDPSSLSQAVRTFLPLVQVTPRGVWGKSQQPTLTTIEAWTGKPMDRYRSPDDAILRYLAAFGPATVADIQAWAGLPGLRDHVARLRPQLVTYRDERNRELLDVPGTPYPDPQTPAPIRFLPGFENALLSHADRTRIISDEQRSRMWKVNGLIDASFLVDGYVAGTWNVTRASGQAVLEIAPFDGPPPRPVQEALETEGLRLLTFLEPATDNRRISIRDSVST